MNYLQREIWTPRIDLILHSTARLNRFRSAVLQRVRGFGTLFGAADGEIKEGRLIKSIRGAGGGYVLAREVESISVGDVLRALEGNLEPVECSGLHPERRMRGRRRMCDEVCLAENQRKY